MRIIAVRNLKAFWKKYPDSKKSLLALQSIVKSSRWKNANEVKLAFPFVSVLKNNRIVFNIKGNDYRLIVAFNFKAGISFVCFIGTHSEYDKVNAETIWKY